MRIGAAALAAALSLTLTVPAFAAGTPSQEEAAQVVSALNIMVGDEKGDMNLEQNVTRAQFVTMAVKASPQGDLVGEAATSPYPDVPRRHWSAGYVSAGVSMGLISGYLDGTFRPDNQITLAEGASIVLKLLGYTSQDFAGAYPTAQMSLYRSLKLDQGVSAQNSTDVLDRRDAMYLFYNLLSTQNKAGQYHLNTLGYSLNAAHEVDRVALLDQVMEGPAVVEEGWEGQLPFSLDSALIHRSGKPIQADSLREGDVAYWNEGMRRVWVYSDRITGAIQSVQPNAAAPTAVQVAGQTYALETSQAAYDLSHYGEYRLGDTVTLLLGRTGGVAAVAGPDVGTTDKVGILTAIHKSSYSGSNGSSYIADTLTVLATDGKTYSYQWSTDSLEVGDLVQVSPQADGSVSIKALRNQPLSGRVSETGDALGEYAFAEDVEILDVYEQSGLRVYPQRLAGVKLSEDMVRTYTLNAKGQIEKLVLEDATGDLHHYGVLTDVADYSGPTNITAVYTLELGGQTQVVSPQGKAFSVKEGPVAVKGSLADPDGMVQLKKAAVDEVRGNTLLCGGKSLTLADHLSVYEVQDGDYYLSNLDRVQEKGLTLTAWYDREMSQGGRVRIVVAK